MSPYARHAGESSGLRLWPDSIENGTAADVLQHSALATATASMVQLRQEAAALIEPMFTAVNGTAVHFLDTIDDGDHVWKWHGIRIGYEKHKDHDLKMVQKEDWDSWLVFFIIFVVLLLFDNFVLHRKNEHVSFGKAACYTVFWIGCAGVFMFYVSLARSPSDAFDWGTGYLLEWMLSVDNLFVFRAIFLAFRTPEQQKHKALFWGIMGAVFFRMLFFALGEMLLHWFHWMTYILGLFLVYTGVKILVLDDEDSDPQDNWILQKISDNIPFVNKYATTPKFFARIPEDQPASPRQVMWGSEAAEVSDKSVPLKATRLMMVVICLETTDIIFAIDSVSAIVAQIPDLFLAYTACVFAMLGLRATFFVIDELVNMFSMLGYAVSFMLIFIGAKLFFKSYVHFPPEVVCVVLVSVLVISIVASIVKDSCCPDEEEKEGDEEDCKVSKDAAIDTNIVDQPATCEVAKAG